MSKKESEPKHRNEGSNKKMSPLLPEDNYLIERQRNRDFFNNPQNLLSFLDHIKSGDKLNEDWNELIKKNPFIEGAIPKFKALYKTKDVTVMKPTNDGEKQVTIREALEALCLEFSDMAGLFTENKEKKERRELSLESLIARGRGGETATADLTITIQSPKDGFISRSGIIIFEIEVESKDVDFIRYRHKVSIEIMKTASMPLSPDNWYTEMEIEPGQTTVVFPEIEIHEDGVYNWYFELNGALKYQGVFKVWRLK